MNIAEAIMNRRQMLHLIGAVAVVALPGHVLAQGSLEIAVTKDPNCGCCNGWVAYLRRAGFPVSVINDADAVQALKSKLGVPDDLAACHTATVAGYALEGHVPIPAIKRLLAERPVARGIAVAGMPSGSPGMPGEVHEVYEVTLFGEHGRLSWGCYKGDKLV
ncbi:DUF411 domain-containing protein [Rhodoligotrophos ferricapiens]|uniref:DUF411 domain-containing protein n=1 Tax=Rhodoligotrophos ferricapiens TaxID=3069264 RepID=UPI00315CAFAC